MTTRLNALLLITLALAGTGCGGADEGSEGSSGQKQQRAGSNACSLLSASEIKSAFGSAIKRGGRAEHVGLSRTCDWTLADDSNLRLAIIDSPHGYQPDTAPDEFSPLKGIGRYASEFAPQISDLISLRLGGCLPSQQAAREHERPACPDVQPHLLRSDHRAAAGEGAPASGALCRAGREGGRRAGMTGPTTTTCLGLAHGPVFLVRGGGASWGEIAVGFGLIVLVLVMFPWLALRVMGERRGRYFLRTVKASLSGKPDAGFKPDWWRDFEAHEAAEREAVDRDQTGARRQHPERGPANVD